MCARDCAATRTSDGSTKSSVLLPDANVASCSASPRWWRAGKNAPVSGGQNGPSDSESEADGLEIRTPFKGIAPIPSALGSYSVAC